MIPKLTLVFASLLLYGATFAQKPVLTGFRNIAIFSPSQSDSATFVHSGGRNSTIPFNIDHLSPDFLKFDYDTCLWVIDQVDPAKPTYKLTREYNAAGKATTYSEFLNSSVNPRHL